MPDMPQLPDIALTARPVLGGCGHWWRESFSGEAQETTPRVCTADHPTSAGAVGWSPQGFTLVEAWYVTPTEARTGREHWPDGMTRIPPRPGYTPGGLS